MLIRTDPFRELDRLATQVMGTTARPAVMPMDAWREDDRFVAEFDLPAVAVDSIDSTSNATCSPSGPNVVLPPAPTSN